MPSYSPHAVAEFTVGIILSVVRKYHKAFNRIREGNFSLSGAVVNYLWINLVDPLTLYRTCGIQSQ